MELRSYDAIFLTAERSLDEWFDVLNWAIQSTRKIVLYVHEDSVAYEDMKKLEAFGTKIRLIPAIRGMWILIESERPEICRVYVCFHKPYYMPKLPEGYIKIHAGKKNSSINLGADFIGDDTGDNISELNPYLNETTMHYWVWKNSRTDYVGFCHYSRYFVIPDEFFQIDQKNYVPIGKNHQHIVTTDEAIELLKDCDIVVRKTFKQNIPFTYGRFFIGNSMFFTRWKVFEKYCNWLFSFIIPEAIEFSRHSTGRGVGYHAESLFHEFVINNDLRIKYLPLLHGGYNSTKTNFSFEQFVND